jgi:4-hydroxy-tetrahydrodipicolinate synthase
MRFEGVCAFPITPADEDGIVDTSALRQLLAPLAGSGVQSVGLLGSTGAAPFFTRTQRRRAVEAAMLELGGKRPVMVGIGALRTADAMLLARDAAACGADAVLLQAVSYTPLTEEEVYRHMASVAMATELPLCIYNNPGTTHFTFTPELIGRLSRTAPIAAVKSPAPAAGKMESELAGLRQLVPAGFSIGASVDARGAEALLAGYDAWYSVLAGALPELCLPLARAAKVGDVVLTRALDAAVEPLWDAFGAYSSLRIVYALAQRRGIAHTHPPLPILPLDEAAQSVLESVLRSLAVPF